MTVSAARPASRAVDARFAMVLRELILINAAAAPTNLVVDIRVRTPNTTSQMVKLCRIVALIYSYRAADFDWVSLSLISRKSAVAQSKRTHCAVLESM